MSEVCISAVDMGDIGLWQRVRPNTFWNGPNRTERHFEAFVALLITVASVRSVFLFQALLFDQEVESVLHCSWLNGHYVSIAA